jgi:septal ring factor EnvC (AmiA/AmiB activator)
MSFIAIFSPGEDQKDLIGNQMLTAPVQGTLSFSISVDLMIIRQLAPSMDSRMEGMMDAIKSLQTKIDEQAKVVESLQTKTDEQEKVVEKLRKELKKERDDRKGDIERLETRNEELEMRNGEQDGIIDSLHKDLKRERDDRMEDIEALKKVCHNCPFQGIC